LRISGFGTLCKMRAIFVIWKYPQRKERFAAILTKSQIFSPWRCGTEGAGGNVKGKPEGSWIDSDTDKQDAICTLTYMAAKRLGVEQKSEFLMECWFLLDSYQTFQVIQNPYWNQYFGPSPLKKFKIYTKVFNIGFRVVFNFFLSK